jgi:cell cycle arrest protein BUB3
MDCDDPNGKLIVSMSERKMWIWDVKMLAKTNQGQIEPWQKRESSLKFMTRTVRCMPDGKGETIDFSSL